MGEQSFSIYLCEERRYEDEEDVVEEEDGEEDGANLEARQSQGLQHVQARVRERESGSGNGFRKIFDSCIIYFPLKKQGNFGGLISRIEPAQANKLSDKVQTRNA